MAQNSDQTAVAGGTEVPFPLENGQVLDITWPMRPPVDGHPLVIGLRGLPDEVKWAKVTLLIRGAVHSTIAGEVSHGERHTNFPTDGIPDEDFAHMSVRVDWDEPNATPRLHTEPRKEGIALCVDAGELIINGKVLRAGETYHVRGFTVTMS